MEEKFRRYELGEICNPAGNHQGTLILLHGYEVNRSQMLDQAKRFRTYDYDSGLQKCAMG